MSLNPSQGYEGRAGVLNLSPPVLGSHPSEPQHPQLRAGGAGGDVANCFDGTGGTHGAFRREW